MPHAFYLTPSELKQIEIAMNDDHPQVRLRAKMLYLAHQGHTFQKITIELNVKSRSTIYNWIKRWQADGIDGLTDAGKSGRPPLMSEFDYQILDAITVMAPQDFGLDQRGWTVEALNHIMQEKAGILISDRGLRDVLHKLDRFSRSLVDTMTYLKQLNELGVSFVSVTESFDFTTPGGKMMMGMLAMFAEWYIVSTT